VSNRRSLALRLRTWLHDGWAGQDAVHYCVVQAALYATVDRHGLNRLEPPDAANGAFADVWHVDPSDVLERR
jgi:hypothetical protein